MARLGVPVRRGGIRAFLVAMPAGVVFSQLLPYVYAPTVGSIQSLLPLSERTRDVFNEPVMALLTGLFSFFVARVMVMRSSE